MKNESLSADAQISSGLTDTMSLADVIIVGTGFYGLTIAERCANELGLKVVMIDKRTRVGGNAASDFDARTGIEQHLYGTHIFHTSNERVWNYVNRFASFNNYRHQVWTTHQGRPFPMPVNLATMGTFFGRTLTPQQARELIPSRQSEAAPPDDLESKAISLIGEPLYRAFIEGYTAKQWQVHPSQLPAEIITRLPVRFNYNIDYFNDPYQGQPIEGFGNWFANMLSSPLITTFLGVDFFAIRHNLPKGKLLIYTGPLDQYFDYKFGRLTWRTLDFDTEHLEVNDFQGLAVMNFADVEIPYTRIHEYKHLHPERNYSEGTIITREFSRTAGANDDPYYPVNLEADRKILKQYRLASERESNVIFGGRLGSYQYLDMHMAIASALTVFDNEVSPRFSRAPSDSRGAESGEFT